MLIFQLISLNIRLKANYVHTLMVNIQLDFKKQHFHIQTLSLALCFVLSVSHNHFQNTPTTLFVWTSSKQEYETLNSISICTGFS